MTIGTDSRRRRACSFAAMCALVMALAGVPARAQDTLRLRWGIFGGYSINIHRADFRALPGVPSCCPEYQSGSGGGAMGGLLAEFPLSTWLLFSIRGSYIAHDADLVAREPVTVIVDGTSRQGAFQHTVSSTIATIGAEPALAMRVAGSGFVSIGARAGIYTTSNYSQEERIVDPTDVGTFLDSNGNDTRSRLRNVNEGALPGASKLLLQGTVGLAYELPLNSAHTLLLVPEISYAASFTDVVSGLTWRPDGVRAGIALKYSPAPEPAKRIAYDTLVVRDTVTSRTRSVTAERVTLVNTTSAVERLESPDAVTMRTTVRENYLHEIPAPPPMTCSLAAVGVNDDGAVQPIATLRIEEFLSTIAHPLLNYVFFDAGSAGLPARYTTLAPGDAAAFRSTDLRGTGTLDVYHTMLNIVGERMRRYPSATIALTGYNMDQGDEKGNIDLSRHRAETVRSYLANVWGIAQSRITVDAANLPAKRSNPLTPDGQAENRRVEIASNMPEVLDVLVIDDTTRTPSPPVVRLAPTITSASAVTSWTVTVSQRGSVLKRFAGSGAPPAGLDWDLANDQQHMPRFDEPLAIELQAANSDGESVTCSMSLPTQVTTVQQKRENRVGDFTIDRFNLILFSVGESVISPTNQRIIDLVKSRLKPKSELTVEGFADRSGNPGPNQRLSASRAKVTAVALGRPDATVRGVGESRLLYDNDIPEGRYYCRTVQILVKTPIQ